MSYEGYLNELGSEFLNVVITHPVEYANVLIRIGYEPCAPVIRKNIFGHNVIELPGIGSYWRHIYRVNGFMGFFPGLTARLMFTALYQLTYRKVKKHFPWYKKENKKNKHLRFLKKLGKEVICTTSANVVAYPFYVVAVRTMAQFVGKETKYNGLLNSLKIIYDEQGLNGLYSGFVPSLFRDLSNVVIEMCLLFVIKSYVARCTDIHAGSRCLVRCIVRNVTYPFQVIATCMAVNDKGLKAGSPPILPIFNEGWLQCWSYLEENGLLTRGLYPMFRYKKMPTSRPSDISDMPVNVTPDESLSNPLPRTINLLKTITDLLRTLSSIIDNENYINYNNDHYADGNRETEEFSEEENYDEANDDFGGSEETVEEEDDDEKIDE